jgi:BirA family transcriptional regulator, biotin operon repressor / biotin---[acetyl-CoA-carboxylase] ligase
MQTSPAVPRFFRVVALGTIDSTSEEAKRLALAGADEGTLVCARQQTAGHGRRGRHWISPAGNLYFSALLRPGCPAGEATQLTFVAAVALADALAAVLPPGRPVTCKWPNDVLVGGRKIAGILLESSVDAQGRVDSLVIGIGVNVASHPPDDQVQYVATSLHAEGAADETPPSMLERLCTAFLVRLEEWREGGFRPVREAWLERAEKLNEPVEIDLGFVRARGIFAGLDDAGALVLQQGDHRRIILAGDVFPAASSPTA